MRESDIRVLGTLGLSKSEAIIYIDLVKSEPSSVIDISKRVGIHRPNVYDSLRRLKEMGIIIEILDGNTKKFKAIEPKKLKLYLKQKEGELDDLIEDLEKIPKKSSEEGVVSVFSGIAIESEFFNILDLKKPLFISAPGDFILMDKKFMDDFCKKRIQHKIPMEIIFAGKSEKAKIVCDNHEYLEARFVDSNAVLKVVTILVDGIVYYFLNRTNTLLIKIKNKELYNEGVFHFERAWKRAQE